MKSPRGAISGRIGAKNKVARPIFDFPGVIYFAKNC